MSSETNALNAIKDLTEAWVGFQRQAWEAWADCVGMSRFDPTWEQLRKRSVTLIEQLTKHCLRAQTDGSKLVMNWTNGNGGDRTELQQQIYDSWFKALRETSPFPSPAFEHLPKNGTDLTESWKRVMQETLQAQAGVISALMPTETESETPQSAPSRKEKGAARAVA